MRPHCLDLVFMGEGRREEQNILLHWQKVYGRAGHAVHQRRSKRRLKRVKSFEVSVYGAYAESGLGNDALLAYQQT